MAQLYINELSDYCSSLQSKILRYSDKELVELSKQFRVIENEHEELLLFRRLTEKNINREYSHIMLKLLTLGVTPSQLNMKVHPIMVEDISDMVFEAMNISTELYSDGRINLNQLLYVELLVDYNALELKDESFSGKTEFIDFYTRFKEYVLDKYLLENDNK